MFFSFLFTSPVFFWSYIALCVPQPYNRGEHGGKPSMKVSIEKRQPDREGKRSLRLVYYYGSNVEDGQRKLKRSHEPLDIFIYDKPRSPAEREHNKEALRIAEAVRSKRLLESETSSISWRIELNSLPVSSIITIQLPIAKLLAVNPIIQFGSQPDII